MTTSRTPRRSRNTRSTTVSTPKRKRVRIHGYNNRSNTAKQLSKSLGLLRVAMSSQFRARDSDVIINVGASKLRCQVSAGTKILNKPEAVRKAINKIQTFQELTDNEIPTVDWTTSRDEAFHWCSLENQTVYARTKLQAHSGVGIVVVNPGDCPIDINYPINESGVGVSDATSGSLFPRTPLYTKGIQGRRREFRVHVFQGEVLIVQKKKRRNGWEQNQDYSNDVRNHSSGWIYSIHDSELPEHVQQVAVNAVAALGLDFGAVDVITKQDQVYVLEVNSAPGMSSPTVIEKYTTAIQNWITENV